MPKAYVIARVTVTDPEAYAEYAKGATAAIRQYDGRPLVRGGAFEALEGEARPRNVVIEFELHGTGPPLLSFARIPGREGQARWRLRGRIRRSWKESSDEEGILDRPGRRGEPRGLSGVRRTRTDPPSPNSAGASWCGAAPFRAVEGESRARNVVIEFPSYEAALACWDSPEYQAAKTKRDGHATAEIIVIEGYEG